MCRISRLIALFLFLLVPLETLAQASPEKLPAGLYRNDKAHTSLTFRVKHLGLSNYTARFTDVDVTMDYRPARPEESKLEAEVGMASVRTDYPYPDKHDFDATLAGDVHWFNSVAFPKARFVSRRLVRESASKGVIEGDLTFLGVTKPLVLHVTFNGGVLEHPFTKQAAMGFSVHGVIKRSEWGLTHYLPMIGDDVDLWIEIEMLKEGKGEG